MIVEETVFEAGKETHMSPILLSSEAFWLRAIEVFLAARVTLHWVCEIGRKRERTESAEILSA